MDAFNRLSLQFQRLCANPQNASLERGRFDFGDERAWVHLINTVVSEGITEVPTCEFVDKSNDLPCFIRVKFNNVPPALWAVLRIALLRDVPSFGIFEVAVEENATEYKDYMIVSRLNHITIIADPTRFSDTDVLHFSLKVACPEEQAERSVMSGDVVCTSDSMVQVIPDATVIRLMSNSSINIVMKARKGKGRDDLRFNQINSIREDVPGKIVEISSTGAVTASYLFRTACNHVANCIATILDSGVVADEEGDDEKYSFDALMEALP
jgi:hypothetical protein